LKLDSIYSGCAAGCEIRLNLRSRSLKLDSIYSGFAAGCEAGLRPAVSLIFERGLRPWFGLWPKLGGCARTEGIARILQFQPDGEA
jgi:hypothetical protein